MTTFSTNSTAFELDARRAFVRLAAGRGARGVLLPDGVQVALFCLATAASGRWATRSVLGAAVMSRGIVGDRAGRPWCSRP